MRIQAPPRSAHVLFIVLLALSAPPVAVQAQKGALTPDVLRSLRSSFVPDAGTKAVMNAVSANSARAISLDRETANSIDNHFSKKIKTQGVTDQKSSGRCWLYAGLNLMRPAAMTSLNVRTFEFSQNFLFFYDKLEKANLFLESIIDTRARPLDDRDVEWLLKNPFPDGGQWNMVTALVDKYGAVPAEVMPETESSGNTGLMNSTVSRYLRRCASELRALHESGRGENDLRQRKTAMLGDVYRMLAIHLGVPPEKFRWRLEDKDGEINEPMEYTPKQFYEKHVGFKLGDYVCLYSVPSHPFGKLYQLRYDRNFFDLPNLTFANVSMELMKELTLKSVLADEPVWFGCDVGKESDSKLGAMKLGLYDYRSLYGVDLDMDKKTRVLYQESIPSHAMLIIGVDVVGGKPEKWLVENSWGAKAGNSGLFTMYDDWFEEYNYTAIIHRKHLPKQVSDIFSQKAVELPPWDPMFAMWLN